ncbi:MAG: hypothetical protein AAFR71_04630 [Pseudomonadota bacterium]
MMKSVSNNVETPPLDQTEPRALISLADHYRTAADHLYEARVGKGLASMAPIRLCALHAIELYLSAYVVASGFPAKPLRACGHDLALRATYAKGAGLNLRARTFDHLAELTESREYLLSRYAPSLISSTSQINRLLATLKEVSQNVTEHIGCGSTS